MHVQVDFNDFDGQDGPDGFAGGGGSGGGGGGSETSSGASASPGSSGLAASGGAGSLSGTSTTRAQAYAKDTNLKPVDKLDAKVSLQKLMSSLSEAVVRFTSSSVVMEAYKVRDPF